MVQRKMLFVDIPGGVSKFVGQERPEFETEIDGYLTAEFDKVLPGVAENVMNSFLGKRDNLEPQMKEALLKYLKIGIGQTSQEATLSLEIATGIKGADKSSIVKAIKAHCKGKGDLTVQEGTPEETLKEFATADAVEDVNTDNAEAIGETPWGPEGETVIDTPVVEEVKTDSVKAEDFFN
jgi:hypothetical protein